MSRAADGPMSRYLVVANQTLGGQPLAEKIRELLAAGPCQFHVVVPATHADHHLMWTEGEAATIAGRRLAEALDRLASWGADADGEVGDSRPVDAVGDAIRHSPPFDAIILSTLPAGLSRWLHQDLPHRLERAFELPVVNLVAEPSVAAQDS